MVCSLNTRRRYMYNQDKLTVPCLTNQYDNTWKHQLIHQPSAHLHVNWKRPCAVVLFLPRRDCETADTADLHWGCSDRSCFSNLQCSALQVRDFTGFFPHANFMIFHSSCVTGLKNAQSPKKCMEHDFCLPCMFDMMKILPTFSRLEERREMSALTGPCHECCGYDMTVEGLGGDWLRVVWLC